MISYFDIGPISTNRISIKHNITLFSRFIYLVCLRMSYTFEAVNILMYMLWHLCYTEQPTPPVNRWENNWTVDREYASDVQIYFNKFKTLNADNKNIYLK